MNKTYVFKFGQLYVVVNAQTETDALSIARTLAAKRHEAQNRDFNPLPVMVVEMPLNGTFAVWV